MTGTKPQVNETALAMPGFNERQAIAIRERWLSCLPAFVGKTRFAEVALAVMRDVKLERCTNESKVIAIYGCARLGLVPDETLGHAYIIPFKAQAKLIVGYKGYVELFHRQPNFRTIHCEVVYRNDHFEPSLGTQQRIIHRPWWAVGADQAGEPYAAYAVAEFAGKSKQIEVMHRTQIEDVKRRSAAVQAKKADSPWLSGHFDEMEMWKKTVLKRMRKKLPVDPEGRLALAAAVDDAAEGVGNQAEIIGWDEPERAPAGTFSFTEPAEPVSFTDEDLDDLGKSGD